MYRLNKAQNSIHPVQKVLFSDLKIRERSHLQEWIAKHPQALARDGDDEILIIQKEFAGFDDTNERLDLLAVDKKGNLVIIENKLDDSGRDVVWQALKYAGYCASLNKEQIVDIFQEYLNALPVKMQGDASEILADFFGYDTLDEAVLNQSQTQRIILVAANFRKEVTNTALWLIEFGLRVQCIRVTPYQLDDEVLLDIRQVIPPPEAEDYMISMAKKEKDELSQSGEIKERHRIRKKFWTEMLDKIKSGECRLYDNINPSTDHWLSAAFGISGLHYSMIFGQKVIRVEFCFTKSDAALNTIGYDWLYTKRHEIEQAFGHKLEWLPLEGKKSCRVQYEKNVVQGFDEENWPKMQNWLAENIIKLEQAMAPYKDELGKVFRNNAQKIGTGDIDLEA